MTSRGASIVFLVQRIGPYHHARLQALAAARSGRVTAVEFRPADAVYAWEAVRVDGAYGRRQAHTRGEIRRLLDGLSPQVVVCTGYSDPEISHAMAWALRRGVPLIVCSDSTRDDEPRIWAKEELKRRCLAAFSCALVAGHRAGEYLTSLGLPAEVQFRPWDVVDNGHFGRGADATRETPAPARNRLGLPSRFFLCVARFVPKKNLGMLLEAYGRYAAAGNGEPWSLVLSGSGPLEPELRARVTAADLGGLVHFSGFLQYSDLPACYGLAEALVLPSVSDQWGLVVNEAMAAGLPVLVSRRCGCADDLVREGENGFSFDPGEPAALAELFGRMTRIEEAKRAAMGNKSREIIAAYSPESFALGLESAVAKALTRRQPRLQAMNSIFVELLALRSAPET